MKSIRPVAVAGLPANGHYSQALVHAGVVYVSGQLGRSPRMSDQEAGDIRAQTRRSLEQLGTILRAAGSDMSRLLRVSLYITDIANWDAVDAEYRQALGTHRPARAIIPTRELHFGALIEIDGIGAIE